MIPLGILAGARVARGLTYRGYASGPSAVGNVTTPAVPIGPAAANRVVIGVLTWTTSGVSRGISAATIGGVTATLDISGNANTGVAVIRAVVPSGTTADVVTTWNSTGASFVLATYTVNGTLTVASSGKHAPADTTASLLSIDLTTTADGIVVAGFVTRSGWNHALSTSGVTADAKKETSQDWLFGSNGNTGSGSLSVTVTMGTPTPNGGSILGAVAYTIT